MVALMSDWHGQIGRGVGWLVWECRRAARRFLRAYGGRGVAVLAGLVLVAGSAVSRGASEYKAAGLERSYRAAVAAVRAANDSATVEAGLTFLAAKLDSTDARVAQVGDWTRSAVLRRVIALAEGKRDDDAKAVLERYQRTASTLTSREATP